MHLSVSEPSKLCVYKHVALTYSQVLTFAVFVCDCSGQLQLGGGEGGGDVGHQQRLGVGGDGRNARATVVNDVGVLVANDDSHRGGRLGQVGCQKVEAEGVFPEPSGTAAVFGEWRKYIRLSINSTVTPISPL